MYVREKMKKKLIQDGCLFCVDLTNLETILNFVISIDVNF